MKIREMFAPDSTFGRAKAKFETTWATPTLIQIKLSERSVAWRIVACIRGKGFTLAAGGVCDTPEQAATAIARRYEFWHGTGPAGMNLLGRAGW